MSTAAHRAKPRSRKLKVMALQAQRRRYARSFAFGAAGLTILLLIAIFAARGESDQRQGSQTLPVTISGAALPAYAEGDDPGVGLLIPSASGKSFDGTAVEIESNGVPKMLVFLAHWCPHCQAEVPVVQNWLEQEGSPEGVDLISIATATDPAQPNYPPSEWLQREGWTVPVLVDDRASPVGEAFGVTSYPFFVFVDGDGEVYHRAAGELEIQTIEAVLGELSRSKS